MNCVTLEYSKKEEIEERTEYTFSSSPQMLTESSPQMLTDDFKPEKIEALTPLFWEPHEYFCVHGYQRL